MKTVSTFTEIFRRITVHSILALLLCSHALAEPERLIFDTDMGNDVDDVQALALIHALERRGKVRLLAVTITKDHPWAAAFTDAVNTFYGRPDVPIGVVKDGVTPEEGKYLGLAQQRDAQAKQMYPHDLESGSKAEEAVTLLRKTLTNQPDGSVSIAQVGFSTNLARLLESQPDAISPLSGEALVKKKVKQLVLMAGAFRDGRGDPKHREYNVEKDVASAKQLAQHWPSPMIWSGFEVGLAIRFPAVRIREDYASPERHLVRDAYLAYCGKDGENPTWDLTAVLQIALPERGYFGMSAAGQVTVTDAAITEFVPASEGKHRFLTVTPEQSTRVREAFTQLCAEPAR